MRAAWSMVLAAILAGTLVGNLIAADVSSWQNLAGLSVAQRIEVLTRKDTVKGEFVRFDDGAITVRDKKGERSVAQADVTRVTLAKRSRGVWIGAAAGGGGGAAVGAALGTRLANESGGDFENLKPAIAVACAGVGALIGAAIGSAARRSQTIYRKP